VFSYFHQISSLLKAEHIKGSRMRIVCTTGRVVAASTSRLPS
jgi:hypothetical protein